MKTFLKSTSFFLLLALAAIFISCEKEIAAPAEDPESPPILIDDEIENPDADEEIEYVAMAAVDPADFSDQVEIMGRKGFRLVFIDGFVHKAGNSTQQFEVALLNLIFQSNVDGVKTIAKAGLTSAQYQAEFDNRPAGYRPTHVESYRQGGKIRYALIFTNEPGPAWTARHGMSTAKFQGFFNEKVSQGYRLMARSRVILGGKTYVTGLFDKKNVGSWVSKSGLDENEIQEMMEVKKEGGVQKAAYLDIAQKTSTDFTYGPIFNTEPHDNWYALNKLSESQLENELEEAASKGYQPTFLVGYDVPGLINGNEVNHLRFAVGFVK